MARGSVVRRHADVEPRVRRGYFECRFGQLHVHNSIPPGGGFDEATPLVCVHDAPASGWTFHRFLLAMGRDRSVYAPDLPGSGESDPPHARPGVADYAAAIGDFLDTMRFRQVDVLGYRCGAPIAVELAIARPRQVRRVVLVGVPLLGDDADREAFRRAAAPAAPAEDGSHLPEEWQRIVQARGPGMTLEMLSRTFTDRLRNAAGARWIAHAVLQHPLRERLGQLPQPLLVLRPRDDLCDATLRAREAAPRARVVDLPELGQGLFEVAPEATSSALREFLQG